MFFALQVRDGAGYLQNPVMRPRGKSHPPDRHFKCPLARVIQHANRPHLSHRNLRVAKPTFHLNSAGSDHPFAHFGGRDAALLGAQFFVSDGRHLNVQIDAVEQWSADLGQIALNQAAGTAAFASRVSVDAARWRLLDSAILCDLTLWLHDQSHF